MVRIVVFPGTFLHRNQQKYGVCLAWTQKKWEGQAWVNLEERLNVSEGNFGIAEIEWKS